MFIRTVELPMSGAWLDCLPMTWTPHAGRLLECIEHLRQVLPCRDRLEAGMLSASSPPIWPAAGSMPRGPASSHRRRTSDAGKALPELRDLASGVALRVPAGSTATHCTHTRRCGVSNEISNASLEL